MDIVSRERLQHQTPRGAYLGLVGMRGRARRLLVRQRHRNVRQLLQMLHAADDVGYRVRHLGRRCALAHLTYEGAHSLTQAQHASQHFCHHGQILAFRCELGHLLKRGVQMPWPTDLFFEADKAPFEPCDEPHLATRGAGASGPAGIRL